MALLWRVRPMPAQLGRLSLGFSTTGIQYKRKPLSPEQQKKRDLEIQQSVAGPHHGESVWVFYHFMDGHTVYSLTPVLKALKALRQIYYKGKKLQPSKFRKDYWQHMAMISFPSGYGNVGQRMFQRLRECKVHHQLSWTNNMYYDKYGRPLTKYQIGKKLNHQRANTIADMAAVLGGLGKGNNIWQPVTDDPEKLANLDAADEKRIKVDEEEGRLARVKVNIWWMDTEDAQYADSWPSNVTHHRFDQAYRDAHESDGAKILRRANDANGWIDFSPEIELAEDRIETEMAKEVEEGEQATESKEEGIAESKDEEKVTEPKKAEKATESNTTQ
ncbi:transcriptional regulation of mitochondrial recombination-domain-containing protein [Jackrogersella minutella]|nr:transcriptional regulation of mitochondrial recombination-domain-containing protein [Jackrogersella minutella]